MTEQSFKDRVRLANDAEAQSNGDYVLYWMTAYRRPTYNHSLDRAGRLEQKAQQAVARARSVALRL